MRRASMAGPAGMVVRSPKNSTSMPLPPMSRSHRRPTSFPARKVRSRTRLASAPSGTMVRPIASRWATNHSYMAGGLSGSATLVIGYPCRASQAPPHSQLPMCGSAMMTPLPASMPATRCSHPLSTANRSRDDVGADGGQPRPFEPVAGVVQEGPTGGGPHLGVAQPRAEHAPEMAPVHGTGLAVDVGQHRAPPPRRPRRRRARAASAWPSPGVRYIEVRRPTHRRRRPVFDATGLGDRRVDASEIVGRVGRVSHIGDVSHVGDRVRGSEWDDDGAQKPRDDGRRPRAGRGPSLAPGPPDAPRPARGHPGATGPPPARRLRGAARGPQRAPPGRRDGPEPHARSASGSPPVLRANGPGPAG